MESAGQGLIPAERRNRILERLRQAGTVRVSALSESLGVAEVTIRRDLELLEGEGQLERTFGGAVLSRRMQAEPQYSEKHRRHPDEKRRIGLAASQLIEEGDTVFIHSGSTTLQIFRHLSRFTRLTVVTSNSGALLESQGLEFELMLTGGTFRETSNSLVGPLALLTLEQFWAGKCFIGVDGVSLLHGLTTPKMAEAQIARKMIERTRGRVIVLADSSKMGVVADCATAPLEKVSTLVTDSGVSEEYRSQLEVLGIQVIVASPE